MGDVIKEIEMTNNKTAPGGIDSKHLPEIVFVKIGQWLHMIDGHIE